MENVNMLTNIVGISLFLEFAQTAIVYISLILTRNVKLKISIVKLTVEEGVLNAKNILTCTGDCVTLMLRDA